MGVSQFGEGIQPDYLNPLDNAYSSIPAVCLSTYLSDSSCQGRLFDPSTYNTDKFEEFRDKFIEGAITEIPLPASFNKESILEIFKLQMKNLSVEYTKLLEETDCEEIESLQELVSKTKDRGKQGFERLTKYLRSDEFPPILWIEVARATETFLMTLQFMSVKIKKWYGFAPRYRSQSVRRNKLVRSMSGHHQPLFSAFAMAMKDFLRMLIFIQIWSCNEEKELFQNKKWTLRNVDRAAFEEIYIALNQSVSSLRHYYFEKSQTRPPIINDRDPVAWAMQQLIRMV